FDVGQPLVYRLFGADGPPDQHALHPVEAPAPPTSRHFGDNLGFQNAPLPPERAHVAPVAHVPVAGVAPSHHFLPAQEWVYFRVGFGGLRLARRRGIVSAVGGAARFVTLVVVARLRDYLYPVARLLRVLGAFGLPLSLLLRLTILARRRLLIFL